MNDDDPSPMSIAEAVGLLRANEPGHLTKEQATRLYALLERTPSIHVLAGGEALVNQYRAALKERLGGREKAGAGERAADSGKSGKGILIAVAALVLAGSGVWYFMQTKTGAENTSRPDTVAAAVNATPAPPPPADTPLVEKSVSAAAKPPFIAPEGEPPKIEVSNGEARLEPNGKGGYRLSKLDGYTRVKLRGSVKSLNFEEMIGRAELDASELTAAHLEFDGQLSGMVSVKLNAPGGLIEFNDTVGGAAKVEINAPEGKVAFQSWENHSARIIGGAHIKITAKTVDFAAGLEGGSKAEVILTNNGSLQYTTLAGSAKLHYRKSSPGDSSPLVAKGDVRDEAKLVEE